jgi:hypothetical protein
MKVRFINAQEIRMGSPFIRKTSGCPIAIGKAFMPSDLLQNCTR